MACILVLNSSLVTSTSAQDFETDADISLVNFVSPGVSPPGMYWTPWVIFHHINMLDNQLAHLFMKVF